MANFVCRKCNFSVYKDKKPARCSYCGEKGSFYEKPSAQDILNETIREFNDKDIEF
jgi:DNA-directed RNA polymerase subunit RPC12/RpoP